MINKNNRIDIQSVQSTLESCANGDSEINEITLSDLITYLHTFTIRSGMLYQNDLELLHDNLNKIEDIEKNKALLIAQDCSCGETNTPLEYTKSRRHIKRMITKAKHTIWDIARTWGDIVDSNKDSCSMNRKVLMNNTNKAFHGDEALLPSSPAALGRSRVTFSI